MKKKIAVIEGDGIGPEVTRQSIRVLKFHCRNFQPRVSLHLLPDGRRCH